MAAGRSRSTSRFLARALVLACLSATAFGFATPPTQAALNLLTTQSTLTTLTGELNPYGMVPVTFSMGKLQAGNFLTTQWNSPAPANLPGQGKTILQVTPQGVATPFATIDTNDARVKAECGVAGVGLTMAISILSKGLVVVGSTPVAPGSSTAGTGCLLVLDTNVSVRAPGSALPALRLPHARDVLRLPLTMTCSA